MARLVGVDLPREKRMEVALTYIFGVGRTRAMATLAATGVDPGKRAKDLSDDEIVQLRDQFHHHSLLDCEQVLVPAAVHLGFRDVANALDVVARVHRAGVPPRAAAPRMAAPARPPPGTAHGRRGPRPGRRPFHDVATVRSFRAATRRCRSI